jgi:hypothetical protein
VREALISLGGKKIQTRGNWLPFQHQLEQKPLKKPPEKYSTEQKRSNIIEKQLTHHKQTPSSTPNKQLMMVEKHNQNPT